MIENWKKTCTKKHCPEMLCYYLLFRARSLYFTVDSSDLLAIGPTRKKIDKSAFILFFPPTCHKTVHHSYIFLGTKLDKNTKKSMKFSINFFLSSDMNMQAYFIFIFFFPTSQYNPFRYPSTIEYSECALTCLPGRITPLP